MAIGAGKYDAIATQVIADTRASVAMVLVIEGSEGSGFSVQIAEPVSPQKLAALAGVLRDVAHAIEADAAELAGKQS